MVSLMGLAGGASSVNIIINGVDNFSNTFGKASKGLGMIGSVATASVAALGVASVALAGLGFASAKVGMDFESAFTGVRKTVNLTEGEFQNLRKSFKDMSEEIPTSFVELSKIGEIAGQLGVEGVDNISKFTRVIADISESTNLSAEAAATDFARIANIMNEPIQNVDKMGSAIVELGNNFAANEVEISNFAQRIAGAGNIAGLTTSDIFAIGTAFSAVGVKAEMGGTAVQKVLNAMTQSVATGDEKLKVFAETAGVSTEEFSEMFKEDAAGAFASFVNGLGESGDDAFGILEDLSLQNERVIRAFLSLANAGDLINRTLDVGTKGFEDNIALTEEAEKRYATLESIFSTIGNAFTNMGDSINTIMQPALLMLTNRITQDVLPALEPLIPLLGEFFKGAIQSILPVLLPMTELLVDFAKILLEDIFPALEPIIGVLGEFGIQLAEVALEVMKQMMPALKQLTPVIAEVLALLGDALIEAITEVAPLLVDLVPVFAELLIALIPLIPPLTELLILGIKFAVITIRNIIPALYGFIDGIKAMVQPLITVIEYVSSLVEWFTELWDKFTQLAGGGLGDLFSKLGGIGGGLLEFVSSPMKESMDYFGGEAEGSSSQTINQEVNIYPQNVNETVPEMSQSLARVGYS